MRVGGVDADAHALKPRPGFDPTSVGFTVDALTAHLRVDALLVYVNSSADLEVVFRDVGVVRLDLGVGVFELGEPEERDELVRDVDPGRGFAVADVGGG